LGVCVRRKRKTGVGGVGCLPAAFALAGSAVCTAGNNGKEDQEDQVTNSPAITKMSLGPGHWDLSQYPLGAEIYVGTLLPGNPLFTPVEDPGFDTPLPPHKSGGTFPMDIKAILGVTLIALFGASPTEAARTAAAAQARIDVRISRLIQTGLENGWSYPRFETRFHRAFPMAATPFWSRAQWAQICAYKGAVLAVEGFDARGGGPGAWQRLGPYNALGNIAIWAVMNRRRGY